MDPWSTQECRYDHDYYDHIIEEKIAKRYARLGCLKRFLKGSSKNQGRNDHLCISSKKILQTENVNNPRFLISCIDKKEFY